MTLPYEVVPCGDPRSPEWYAARRHGIGSSEAAAVLGWGKWASPLAVWLEKTETLPPESSDSPQMLTGRMFEGVVADVWSMQTGIPISTPPAILRSTRWPILAASVDRYAETDDGPVPLEVKCVWNNWDDWRDGVPDYYVAQVIHQLIVMDLDMGYVAALQNGEVKSYEVHADAQLRHDIAKTLTDWWETYVVPGVRPPLDPIPDRALLDRAVPRPLRKQVEVSDEFVGMLHKRADEAKWESAAKAEKDVATNWLCARMDDAEEAVYSGQVVATWKPNKAGTRVFRPASNLPALTQTEATDAHAA